MRCLTNDHRFSSLICFAMLMMKKLQLFSQVLLLFLTLSGDFTVGNTRYYILPSQNSSCLHDPCLTLSEVASDFNSSDGNIFLLFQSGNHTLDTELTLSDVDRFSMTKEAQSDEEVILECSSQSGSFDISESTFVLIKDIRFIGCRINLFNNIENLVIEDSTFQGVQPSYSALVLLEVTSASILSCVFLFNTHAEANAELQTNASLFEQNSFGGAMYTNSSNVWINDCKFMHNTAEYGGVLYAYNSSLHIEGSTFRYNRANSGGVMYTSDSSITIENSSFAHNKAGVYGGVITSYTGLITVTGATFTHNSADSDSGVLDMFDSSFSIANSSFSDNTAEGFCGAICTINTSFEITSSNFSNNSATYGGVLYTGGGSFLNVTNSIFNNNHAKYYGGVMSTSDSTFNIESTYFTNNSAVDDGGALYVHRSTFHITSNIFNSNYAGYGGAIVTFGESSFSIHNSSFSENIVTSHGGAIDIFSSSFKISDCDFTNNSGIIGGALATSHGSSFEISNSTFENNRAVDRGGVLYITDSTFNVTDCTFSNNLAGIGVIQYIEMKSPFTITDSALSDNFVGYGGVMSTEDSSFDITGSNFLDNTADNYGGVLLAFYSSFSYTNCNFMNNSAVYGGVMVTETESSLTVNNCFFNNNIASFGGVLYAETESSFNVTNSDFTDNIATSDGGVMMIFESSFDITSCDFTGNSAIFGGVLLTGYSTVFSVSDSTFTRNNATILAGVMLIEPVTLFSIINCSFVQNIAIDDGGVMHVEGSSFSIIDSTFSSNQATDLGGVMATSETSFNITNSITILNRADFGGVIVCSGGTVEIENTTFSQNTADVYGGAMLVSGSSLKINNSRFDHNIGSLFSFNSNLTFTGFTKFDHCVELPIENFSENVLYREQGGAITSFQSNLFFTGVSILSNNEAGNGGAILATETKIVLYGETLITNNKATEDEGGGISLQLSDLEVHGNCNLTENIAVRGGAIYASSSVITVYNQGTLQFISNSAEEGGGLYLQVNPKVYLLKPSNQQYVFEKILIFTSNRANYGGAVYVADDTSECQSNIECFIQVLAIHPFLLPDSPISSNIMFRENLATEQGSNLFGGLLDRCVPSPFAEVYLKRRIQYSGVTYLQNISNITLDSISSFPVRICFCNSNGQQNCSYQLPPVEVERGEKFTVSLVAVDHVNRSMETDIVSFLLSSDGGFGEGQQTQRVRRNCTDITFNVFSSRNSETIILFASGPCGRAEPSIVHLDVRFVNCSCPIGFEPSKDKPSRCECICDSRLSDFINNCNYATKSLIRVNTNSWITFLNNTSKQPGYVIHPFCPFDFCQSPTENVSINLNLHNGADTQCALNRTGVLCGACQQELSLSLGSSRCLRCQNYWPAVFLTIILAAAVAGILLVTAVLMLNMTVANGLISGFIFYANIVAANSSIFFPSSEPSFPTVFVAWLNLDVGIDVCFIDGLDAYSKTWLQLAFPVYIIFLVILIIVAVEVSPRFAQIIGKRDPIATLATLILLSYAKLLSITISVLSYAVLDYPDGSRETVWLLDGNVKYFRSKHVVLVIAAVLIVLISAPYTVLLFLWQWIVRAPRWKIFMWTRNTKLNAFIATYHAPYNIRCRYWTGLLLLVRVVLYITASVTVSANPQTSLLMTAILIAGLILLRESSSARVYKKSLVDFVDAVLYFNLLGFALFTFFDFKANASKQSAVAYISTIITFVLLALVIIYHIHLYIKKNRKSKPRDVEMTTEYSMYVPPVQSAPSDITHSFIEVPKPQTTNYTESTICSND